MPPLPELPPLLELPVLPVLSQPVWHVLSLQLLPKSPMLQPASLLLLRPRQPPHVQGVPWPAWADPSSLAP